MQRRRWCWRTPRRTGSPSCLQSSVRCPCRQEEREFLIDNLLVRIHLIIEMVLVDWPCAMGVEFPFPGSLMSTVLDTKPSLQSNGSLLGSGNEVGQIRSALHAFFSQIEYVLSRFEYTSPNAAEDGLPFAPPIERPMPMQARIPPTCLFLPISLSTQVGR